MIAAVLGTALVSAACPRVKAPAAPKQVTVFLTADLRGYLEPCGCSENMLGGIHRAAEQVARARKEGHAVLLADGGDALFGRVDLTAEQVPQAERKAKAIAEAFTLMGNDAMAVGEKDLVRGEEFLKSTGIRGLLRTGARPASAPTITYKDVEGAKVAFVATGSETAQLQRGAEDARAQGADIVVGLVHLSVADATRAVDALPPGLLDAAIAGHSVSELDGEENRAVSASVPVLQVMSKGRSLARLDFFIRPGAPRGFVLVPSEEEQKEELEKLRARIAREEELLAGGELTAEAKAVRQSHLDTLRQRLSQQQAEKPKPPEDRSFLTVTFIKLNDELPANAQVKDVIARYTRDVAKLNLEYARKHGKDCPAPRPGQSAYVGDAACRDCHEEAFPVWEKSGHHHAYETLEKVDKQFDLDCVRCHVTGMNAPGGVCRVDKVEGRKDVQCESCHGPGSQHVENPAVENIVARPGEESCKGCHNPENSPNFDFAKYLPKILGPGHGEPAPEKAPGNAK